MKSIKLSLICVFLCVLNALSANVFELQVQLNAQANAYAALPLNDGSAVVIELMNNELQFSRRYKDSSQLENEIALDDYYGDYKIYASLLNEAEIAVILYNSNDYGTNLQKYIVSTDGVLVQKLAEMNVDVPDSIQINSYFDDFFLIDDSDVYTFHFQDEYYPELIIEDFDSFLCNASIISFLSEDELLLYKSDDSDYIAYNIKERSAIFIDKLKGTDVSFVDVTIDGNESYFNFYSNQGIYSFSYYNGMYTYDQYISSDDHIIRKNEYALYNRLSYESYLKDSLNEDIVNCSEEGILTVNDQYKLLGKEFYSEESYLLILQKANRRSSKKLILLEYNEISDSVTIIKEVKTSIKFDAISNFSIDNQYLYFEVTNNRKQEAFLLNLNNPNEIESAKYKDTPIALNFDPKTNFVIASNPEFRKCDSRYFEIQNTLLITAGNTLYFYGVEYAY